MTGIIITSIICATIIILFGIAIKFNFICNHQWEKKSDINVYGEVNYINAIITEKLVETSNEYVTSKTFGGYDLAKLESDLL